MLPRCIHSRAADVFTAVAGPRGSEHNPLFGIHCKVQAGRKIRSVYHAEGEVCSAGDDGYTLQQDVRPFLLDDHWHGRNLKHS